MAKPTSPLPWQWLRWGNEAGVAPHTIVDANAERVADVKYGRDGEAIVAAVNAMFHSEAKCSASVLASYAVARRLRRTRQPGR